MEPLTIWKVLAFQKLESIQDLKQGKMEIDGDSKLTMCYSKAAQELAISTKDTDRNILTKYELE
ncbi:MAG: hypothetical protein EU549_04830 [Promethearchaeota archaeon]|nr:MAG: hypothetical protein EU549_04830 [Candidatus Lokiarchaeota archaeon]